MGEPCKRYQHLKNPAQNKTVEISQSRRGLEKKWNGFCTLSLKVLTSCGRRKLNLQEYSHKGTADLVWQLSVQYTRATRSNKISAGQFRQRSSRQTQELSWGTGDPTVTVRQDGTIIHWNKTKLMIWSYSSHFNIAALDKVSLSLKCISFESHSSTFCSRAF